MIFYSYGTGKGLKDTLSPFRECKVFGEPLNSPNADDFLGLAVLYPPTSTFDLSTIAKGREVAVHPLRAEDVKEGCYDIRWEWKRKRDGIIISTFHYRACRPAHSAFFAYSYIGWVDWEINENGDYEVIVSVTGADIFLAVTPFTITGIPKEEEPEAEPEEFMPFIVDYFLVLQDYFNRAATTVYDWFYPFNLLALPLDWAQYSFGQLAKYFSTFSLWIKGITEKVIDYLSPSDILNLLSPLTKWGVMAWEWIQNASQNIGSAIEEWWAERKQEIDSWREYFSEQFTELRTAWDYFWTVLFPQSVSFDALFEWWHSEIKELQGIIDSAFAIREKFWEGWLDWKDTIAEFFTDPLEWLQSHFVDWFLGKE